MCSANGKEALAYSKYSPEKQWKQHAIHASEHDLYAGQSTTPTSVTGKELQRGEKETAEHIGKQENRGKGEMIERVKRVQDTIVIKGSSPN